MSVEKIEDIDRLKRINKALMTRVESAMDQQGNAFSLFQTAINLEGQVKRRTDELTVALRGLEKTNSELALAKEASEIANLSKTRFLAAASHDVLQPLNAAFLSLSVLADIQDTELGRKLAAQVERSLETMNDLLKTLLDISKLDAGIVEPRIENVALASLFDSLRSDFEPVASGKGLELRFRQCDAHVLSDRTMLRRILQNLISNSLRYTVDGGVLVGVRPRHKGQKGQEAIHIDVVDTGSGIPEEQQIQVFEEFHRGALPRGHERDAESGLGLGLSIVKRMASALHHDLLLTSIEGKGSRFRITVPLGEKNKRISPEKEKPVISGGLGLAGTKILLIENDAEGIQAAVSLFDSWGCVTRVTSTVDGTVVALGDAGWMPDILVADLNLDYGDLGTIAVSRAREYLGKAVPALIITADPTKTLEQEIREMNMNLMHKPLKPAQLRALMAHILS